MSMDTSPRRVLGTRFFVVLAIICMSALPASAQYPGWTLYADATVRGIAQSPDALWIGTNGSGVIRIDRTTGINTAFTTVSSSLHDNVINGIVVDGTGRVWAATPQGLSMFDGTLWRRFDSIDANTKAPPIYGLAVSGSGAIWMATENGLHKFDGVTWTVYDSSDYGFPTNSIPSVAVASDGSLWAGVGASWFGEPSFGVVHFDGDS